MLSIYANSLNRCCLCLLYIVFLCSLNFIDAFAESDTPRYRIGRLNRAHLRGEISYGMASWYGRKFHGRRTSSGEKYNKNKLTAAHKHFPFNTQVLVTNLENNKSVVVRINDRGPFKGARVIDLSEEAAEKIDAKKQGITNVRLQVLPHTSSN